MIHTNTHRIKTVWRFTGCLVCLLILINIDISSQDAASPIDELKSVLTALKEYQQGQNDDLVLRMHDFLRKHRFLPEYRDACEAELMAFLDSEATAAAKMEVCRQLRVFGSAASVPVLKKMLSEENTADPARYTLEKIPGAEADKALMDFLETSGKKIQLGIISSLGKRKVEAAAPVLEQRLFGSDEDLASASAEALSEIGNPEAVRILRAALDKTKNRLQTQVAEALMICAESAFSSGNKEAAAKIYGDIFNRDLRDSLRGAALSGKIRSAGASGRTIIWNILQGKEKSLYLYAIQMILECCDYDSIKPFIALLPKLSYPYNVYLISVLAKFKSPEVLSAVTASLHHEDQSMRLAALDYWHNEPYNHQPVDHSSSVELLARLAASAGGEEQEAAREYLWNLSGGDIDSVILDHMGKDLSPEVKAEYIMSIGERRIYAGKTFLMDIAESPDPSDRLLAIKTLKDIAQPDDLPRLLDVLMMTTEEREGNEMILTVAQVARKIQPPSGQGDIVVSRLSQVAQPEEKARLYRVLGKIGDDSTLSVLRKDMFHDDPVLSKAVVYALADWPNSSPRDDLFQIASRTDDRTSHVVALQAFIRQVEMDKYRMPEDAVKDLNAAVKIARRNEEKIAVLGLLPQFACREALALAELLSQDNALKAEAEMAVGKIKNILEK
ncbi:MAG: HEAT repeat domain-containing protein [Candidatus Aminicenantes bacterium]|nr:HEAT repeat domain-containing protein [Candidatus Aminicenantes bacterium]